jgi:hypothetical protein
VLSLPLSTIATNRFVARRLTTNQVLPSHIVVGSCAHRLDLSMNKLASLPESVGELSYLRWLDLSQNQLTELPFSFGACVIQ